MMARGFKPVGWVASVAAAALGCYMLSLNVASERAELARLERSIIAAKGDIRALQTELGTRGRLQQLESWNANVLALSAPTSAQFLDNELTLARFDQREQSIEERSVVHMASAAEQPAPKVEAKVRAPVHYAAAPPAPKPAQPLVHQASLSLGVEAPVAAPRPMPAPLQVARKPSAPASAKPAVVDKKPVPVKVASAGKKPVPTKVASADKKPLEPAKKKASGISSKLVKEIGDAAKSEKSGSAGGQ